LNVKPRNGINNTKQKTSTLQKSFTQSGKLSIESKKSPTKSRAFPFKLVSPLERRIYP
jgi:hypothetical protein